MQSQQKTLTDWLKYMQSIHISAIDMGLSRVLPIAKKLNLINAAKESDVFVVAGTNGKGSTTAVIAEICKTAGYKTALYQSPHLVDFNERIKINGDEVSDHQLITAFEHVEQARLDCNLTLSFFEMTTLAAFLIFSQSECDVWVLEVGLGGRLDVVNIIDADVAVITNIAIDHTDWLGDDREKIGYEKAGILREGMRCVLGSSDMPQSVYEICNELNVHKQQINQDYSFIATVNDTSDGNVAEPQAITQSWIYSNAAITMSLPKPKVALINASNAISAVLMSDVTIKHHHIEQALKTVSLQGRLDVREFAQRRWIFDVAHNTAGVQFVLSQLDEILARYKNTNVTQKVHIVFSMLEDKDITAVVNTLLSSKLPIAHLFIAPLDKSYCPRAASSQQLIQAFEYQGYEIGSPTSHGNVHNTNTIADAVELAISTSDTHDLIFVCGSFYTIKEALTHLTKV